MSLIRDDEAIINWLNQAWQGAVHSGLAIYSDEFEKKEVWATFFTLVVLFCEFRQLAYDEEYHWAYFDWLFDLGIDGAYLLNGNGDEIDDGSKNEVLNGVLRRHHHEVYWFLIQTFGSVAGLFYSLIESGALSQSLSRRRKKAALRWVLEGMPVLSL